MMVLNSNYRSPLVYTDEVVQQSERALERLRSALRPALPDATGAPEATLQTLQAQIEATRQGFIEAMDDDFNTSGALAAIFELVRAINQARSEGATNEQLAPAQAALRELTGVLGLTLEEPAAAPSAAEPFIDLLIEVRTELRKQKLWALSDRIRDRLAELGVILEDSREGTTWRWKTS